jgi:predicted ATPase/class 3 adenylate cyclase
MAELPTGTVTFLFTDIEGSTRLWERHPTPMRASLARHDTLLRSAIEAHGGYVLKTVGDAFCAAFAAPPDALTAALAAQCALFTEGWEEFGPLRVRMALHTGVVEERGRDYFGPPLNRVARLLALGHGGQTLLSRATYELVRDALPEGVRLQDLGAHRLKDLQRSEQVFQLLHPDLPADFPPLKSLGTLPHNLPIQPTPFLGRDQETAVVRDYLLREEVRLLTLTGPAGSGKTRLGLQVAVDLIDAFRDGAFFVALAPITDPGLVATSIAQALTVRETTGRPLLENLREYLQDKHMLLLLDNFEHVPVAAGLVAELLASCPRLKVLVTSRAALHLRGEHEFPVPPLALPNLRPLPPVEALSQYAAVELFIQRALAVKPDFRLTNENAPAVAEICHRLDGLPLAIELATARIKLFPPQALLGRLGNRLKLLTGGARDLPTRQQTLRNSIAWSYDLLDPEEQKLFRRLSVFVGGCKLEAAEAVCNAEGDLEIAVLDGVASLVDKSLLGQTEGIGGEPRFLMLETIREFGWGQLQASEEADEVGRQHAGFFLALVEEEEPKFAQGDQRMWLDRLEQEHANLRAALAWSMETGEVKPGLRLAGALWQFWDLRGHWGEGRNWLAGLLLLAGSEERTAARAKALYTDGLLAWRQSYTGEARTRWEESLAIYQELGNRGGIARLLEQLGMVARGAGDLKMARTLWEQSLAICRELGQKPGAAASITQLGTLARLQGDLRGAGSCFEEGLRIYQELGDQWGTAFSLNLLGWVARQRGDPGMARSLWEQSLAIWRKVGAKRDTATALADLGKLAASQGDWEAARARHEERLAILRELGNQRSIAWSLEALGTVAFSQSDNERAERLFSESLMLFRQVEDKQGIAACLEGLARLANAHNQRERAARLFGATEALRESIGGSVPPAEQCKGAEAFAAAWAEGRAMTLGAAIEYALMEADKR